MEVSEENSAAAQNEYSKHSETEASSTKFRELRPGAVDRLLSQIGLAAACASGVYAVGWFCWTSFSSRINFPLSPSRESTLALGLTLFAFVAPLLRERMIIRHRVFTNTRQRAREKFYLTTSTGFTWGAISFFGMKGQWSNVFWIAALIGAGMAFLISGRYRSKDDYSFWLLYFLIPIFIGWAAFLPLVFKPEFGGAIISNLTSDSPARQKGSVIVLNDEKLLLFQQTPARASAPEMLKALRISKKEIVEIKELKGVVLTETWLEESNAQNAELERMLPPAVGRGSRSGGGG